MQLSKTMHNHYYEIIVYSIDFYEYKSIIIHIIEVLI